MDKFDTFLKKIIRSKLEYKDGIYFSQNTNKISFPKEKYLFLKKVIKIVFKLKVIAFGLNIETTVS